MAGMSLCALNNEDIIYLICNCLTPNIDGRSLLETQPRERARSLARLARVCKRFNLPASRTLWRRLRDMYPLLRLFPGLGVKEAGDDAPDELDVSSNLAVLARIYFEFFPILHFYRFAQTLSCLKNGPGFACMPNTFESSSLFSRPSEWLRTASPLPSGQTWGGCPAGTPFYPTSGSSAGFCPPRSAPGYFTSYPPRSRSSRSPVLAFIMIPLQSISRNGNRRSNLCSRLYFRLHRGSQD